MIRGKNSDKSPLVVNTGLSEWSDLHPDNIKDFMILYGILNECKEQYPGGILPGMVKKDDNTQTSKIRRFDNLLEWTKLLEEDVYESEGKLFLRSKFFERREKAWKSPFFLKREGEIVGYYIDSVLMHKDDAEWMQRCLFSFAYKDLIRAKPSYQNIVKHLKNGGSVDLQAKDIRYSLTPTFKFENTLETILLEDSIENSL